MNWITADNEPPLETPILFLAKGKLHYGKAFKGIGGITMYELDPSRIDYHVYRKDVTHWMKTPDLPITKETL